MIFQHVEIFVIGMLIGFLGGLFGKGGSAIATPLLSLIGIPGFVAVAAPLPATVPGTFIASLKYWKSHLLDKEVVLWSIIFGFPSVIAGAYFTKYMSAKPLLVVTGVLVLAFGLSFILSFKKKKHEEIPAPVEEIRPSFWRLRLTSDCENTIYT